MTDSLTLFHGARTSAENGTNASQKVFQSKIFVHADARRMISAINYCMNMRKQTALDIPRDFVQGSVCGIGQAL